MLACSLGFSIYGWHAFRQKNEERARQRFDHLVERAQTEISLRMRIYEDVLRGAASLFAASDYVTQEQWRKYALSVAIHDRNPGILGMGFIERVSKSDKDDFEKELSSGRRKPKYHIYPPGEREEYWAVKFIEPRHRNLSTLGFDIGTDPHERLAAVESMDTGKSKLTMRMPLKQETGPDLPGFTMFIPVYHKDMPTSTPEERKEALHGWIYAPFISQTFLTQLLDGADLSDIDMEIYEGENRNQNSLLFDSDPDHEGVRMSRVPVFAKTQRVNVLGHPWTLYAVSRKSYEGLISGTQSLLVLAGGVVFSFCLFFVLYSVLYTRNQAVALANDMTVGLKRARDAAVEASQHKSRFLANMSHEIRTPINGISGMADLLLNMPLTEEPRKYAQAIKQSVGNLLGVINSILDFSKIESGKMELESVPFDLRALLEDLELAVRPQAERKGIFFKTDVPSDLANAVVGDPSRVRQILLNLLGNAVKFTSRGGVVLQLSQKSTSAGRVLLTFEIADTGIGIPKEALGKLFEPFTQADSSTTRRFGGTGLGLSISRELARLMNGTITAKSEEGKGSTFTFMLPIEVGESEGRASVGAAAVAGSGRVLIGEDNDMNREVALRTVEQLGYSAEAVANGKELLRKLEAEPFDVVLLDCQMPEMDGYEAARYLRNHSESRLRSIPIVAMTANAFTEDRERCLASGMDDYISKPFDREQLAKLLKKWSARGQKTAVTAVSEKQIADLRSLDKPGRPSVLESCVRLFYEQTPQRLGSMRAALSKKDAKALAREAHSLRTSCAIIGALPFSELCGSLERSAESGQWDLIPGLLETADAEYARVQKALAEIIHV